MRIMHPVASWTITAALRTRHFKAWVVMEGDSAWMPEFWFGLAFYTQNASFAARADRTGRLSGTAC
jgi:hypothetical protein